MRRVADRVPSAARTAPHIHFLDLESLDSFANLGKDGLCGPLWGPASSTWGAQEDRRATWHSAQNFPHAGLSTVHRTVQRTTPTANPRWRLCVRHKYRDELDTTAGLYARALAILEAAFELRERMLGPDASYVASRRHDLGLLRNDRGQSGAALALLEQAHAILVAVQASRERLRG